MVSARPSLDKSANSKSESRFSSLLKDPGLLATRPGYLEGRYSSPSISTTEKGQLQIPGKPGKM
jgi:hypothetical protein